MSDLSFLSKFGVFLILLAFSAWLHIGNIFGLSKRTQKEYLNAIKNKDISKIRYFKIGITVNKYFMYIVVLGFMLFAIGLYL